MKKLNAHNRRWLTEEIIDLLKQQERIAFRLQFLELHSTDQRFVFLSLNEQERTLVYEYITPQEFAEIFQGLDNMEQGWAARELEEEYLAKVLDEMYSDDVADFLGSLSGERQASILAALEEQGSADVRELLSYPEETAGAVMTKEFISVRSDQTIQEVIERLRRETPNAETIYYIYVTDAAGHLVGVVSLRELITSSPEKTIEKVMGKKVISTSVTTDQEDAAHLISEYDLLAIPVLTHNDVLVGIITVDDVIDILEEEATEDVGELSASRGATDVNVTAVQAAKKRAPWIVLLMFLGLITANVIGQFEETLEAVALLSAFIPLIMDSAGNTGTQSLAVAVRSLATGSVERKGVIQLLKRELGIGILLGIISAIVLIGIIRIFYGNLILAVIVATSLFLTLSVAALIGAIFPLIINKLNIDPAVASGPFITTLNDIIGLLIYFTIATSLLQYL
ncbi:magnesium transporter [Geomicrobium halophilum]|uniref:Magnesium transporter MgtE n=1 Tax=Geomicrobium halophilum TaxID=549000 RepID=A0A841Q082_9BACL|nr:magnesium transporter [Geomicrobium halophilum]MBB6450953.1 magnesium transporter [Geomicrobium halophilum]